MLAFIISFNQEIVFNSFCGNILTLMGLLLTDIFTQLKYKMQQRKGETKEIRNECKRNSEQNLLFSQIEIYLSSTDTTKLILGVKVKVRLRTKSNPPIISDQYCTPAPRGIYSHHVQTVKICFMLPQIQLPEPSRQLNHQTTKYIVFKYHYACSALLA